MADHLTVVCFFMLFAKLDIYFTYWYNIIIENNYQGEAPYG